jgi:hypothetical protein
MSETQIDTLAAAASKEATRYTGQGEASQFLLSKDGSFIAMRQDHPPLREFSVADALARSPAEHWREAVDLNQDSQQQVRPEQAGQALAASGHTPPEREAARAMA